MCGIAGIIADRNINKTQTVQSMLAAIKHRGPDYSSQWSDAHIALGHNRLSIIDLSTSAAQPMCSANGRYIIIFNGEIYNYRELKTQYLRDYLFVTQSDTEVLLAAYIKWGKDMLSRLNGMFAFAIWDTVEQKLFAARDRFGVKPFYYSLNNGLTFASEIKALWAAGVPKIMNNKVWASYLTYGSYGLLHETFWKDIFQLPAGHMLEQNNAENSENKKTRITKWYDFAENIKLTVPMSEISFREQYFDLLGDSIRLRFRADVPVGFNVSGGLDSSTLLALINKEYGKNGIEAFSFYTGHPDYDELPWVIDLISLTDNPLNSVLLTAEDVPALSLQISKMQDEPFGGIPTLAYSKIFKNARDKNIIVLLDGQGMDEAWAGYDYYHNQSGHIVQGTKSSPVRPEVLLTEFRNHAIREVYSEPFDNELMNLQYRDLFYTKIPRALRFNDRVSMMHSTELREPFLDYRLVELAFAQPAERKMSNGQTKYLLRRISQQVLGNKIALAPKRPLQTPQREWLSHELKEWVNDNVNTFAKFDFIDKNKLCKVWNDYINGDNDNSFFVWQWINSVEIL